MKKLSLAALLISAVVAAPAFASGYSPAPTQTPSSVNGPKTRAEVRTELAQARASGELSLNPNAPAYPQQFATGGYTVPVAHVDVRHLFKRTTATD
ncbi:DUF4148 domain-containing protein [Paraburkholderia sabiae]|jgi:hypothetical protein|uniref:DUF4148 domain-containing protein n=1 Tax=Paraburkholderia sabiae TaxID=273251 RepID=A0ABU9QQE9_9BURK|nr:DUF4148 domain-containing protein [Paraburkholderia sabiae]WJZ74346.1 DUF4148 domain-containing protein [Paraburkholderia sabiae]CAD6562552.1 hypothetical protein LMG24235_07790 [Paraburkholderia sabiae]CAG9237461.1 conserved exported hypothetical protein [Paraburkholderia sabiae]